MIIELRGVGTINKGAYLMLLSIIQHFKEVHPNENITFVSNFGAYFPKKDGISNGIQELHFTKRKGIEFGNLINFIPKKIRRRMGIFIIHDVDVILDGSGFAYGDQWSAASIRWKLSGAIEHLKNRNVKVILMPQAFGPFRQESIRKEVKKIMDYADLIFVRDKMSEKYINEAYGQRPNIFNAPDFTNLLKVNNLISQSNRRVLIIPNYKLVEKTQFNRNDLIVKFKKIIELIQINNCTPEFLIHEGKKDEQIAIEVNNLLKNPIKIHLESDAFKQKKLIGESFVVITGRFHGLVSALSQSVPSIALSWSHKYEMLLEDYKQKKYLINLEKNDDSEIIREILNIDHNNDIRRELEIASQFQKIRTEEMWSKVDSLIFSYNE